MGSWGAIAYHEPMKSWTERTTTTAERRRAKEEAMAKSQALHGEVRCARCGGREGEVNAEGKLITRFELDHRANISLAGADRAKRRKLEMDPANHQLLCDPCHWSKTLEEAKEGRMRKSGRSKRKHPGVVW